MSRSSARRAASALRVSIVDELRHDVRYALRALRRNPVFATMAILSLALGAGANLAIFNSVYSALLEPLPYRDADRLMYLSGENHARGWLHNPVAGMTVDAWRARNHTFADMALFSSNVATIDWNGTPVQVRIQRATPNLFDVLGVRVALGVNFAANDGQRGGETRVILSHAFWVQRFGGDVHVIGQAMAFGDASATIVGVMPPDFTDRFAASMSRDAVLWVAAALDPNADDAYSYVVARLRPGVSRAAAERDMDAISRQIETERAGQIGWRVGVMPLRDAIAGPTRTALLVLFGAALFVMHIACATVATLLLARGAAREREIAVRGILGASRRRLVRQLLTEGAVLGVLSAVVGVIVAVAGMRSLSALAPTGVSTSIASHELPALAAYAALSLIVTVALFALVPAISMSQAATKSRLDAGGRSSTHAAGTMRFRSALIVTEFALAVVLVVGAGLMIRTLRAVRDVHLGLDARHVTAMSIPLSSRRYALNTAYRDYWRTLLPQISRLPGVAAVAVASGLPTYSCLGLYYAAPDQPPAAPGNRPSANFLSVSPDYFATLGIPIVQGRAFRDSDDETQRPVAIVNQELAKRTWPDQDPIGRTITVSPWDTLVRTVIGVAGNVHTEGADAPVEAELYAPYTQPPLTMRPRQLLVRSAGNDSAAIAGIRRAMAARSTTRSR